MVVDNDPSRQVFRISWLNSLVLGFVSAGLTVGWLQVKAIFELDGVI